MTDSLARIVALGVVVLGGVGSAMAQNCRWTDPFPYPSTRIGESMAYDSARGVCVLFGGRLQTAYRDSDETWVWDGLDWVLRSVVGPLPRASHKMAYDSAREVVVLFGGSTRTENLGDTWEWDGQRWHQRAGTGPPARRFHAMAYDSARGVTVVYGGFGGPSPGAVLDDTWEWDGNTWTRVAQTGPALNYAVEMAYDASRGVLVLHGCSVAGLEPQTWEWDGLEWTKRGVGGVACLYQEMAYDSARRVIVLSAGRRLWEYDGTNWTLGAIGYGRGGSATFAFAYDSRRGVTVLWESLSSWRTGEWDGAAWSYPLRLRPPLMSAPAMVYDAHREVSLLVGNYYNKPQTESWEWDGLEWELRMIGGPSARTGHALAYDSARHVTTLFGGEDASGVNGETWEWDGLSWTMVSNAGPSPRKFAAMSYDEARGVTVLTGGTGPTFTSGEVWEWDGTSWTQRGWLPVGVFQNHSMVFDRLRNVTVLSGRGSPSGSGTWEYDGQTWTHRSPVYFSQSSMIFDERLGAVVAVVETSTWIWDGATWSVGPSNAPNRGRYPSEAAYDIARQRTVIFVKNNAMPTTMREYGCDCYADCDRSGVLDLIDFICFGNSFVLGEPYACDCDTSTGPGVCDLIDFLCFQNAFARGCP